MMITAGHTSYIRKEDVKAIAQLTAATINEVFQHLLTHSEVKKIFYHCSLNRWHNQRDMDDAHAELVSYLAAWEPASLIDLFNSHRFNFWLVAYCKRHLGTKGFFYQKYTDREKQDFSIEMDGQEEHHKQLQYESDDSSLSTLSIMQFVKLITHLLNSNRAKAMFQQEHVDFYIKHFVQPIADGKKYTIKAVAEREGINYKLLANRIRTIKRFLKSCIQDNYDSTFTYNK